MDPGAIPRDQISPERFNTTRRPAGRQGSVGGPVARSLFFLYIADQFVAHLY